MQLAWSRNQARPPLQQEEADKSIRSASEKQLCMHHQGRNSKRASMPHPVRDQHSPWMACAKLGSAKAAAMSSAGSRCGSLMSEQEGNNMFLAMLDCSFAAMNWDTRPA